MKKFLSTLTHEPTGMPLRSKAKICGSTELHGPLWKTGPSYSLGTEVFAQLRVGWSSARGRRIGQSDSLFLGVVGRQTQDSIDAFQNFCGIAIREN
ncbi:unnamed protein product [Pocillopora meandrina]|uniref:Uncharacterized protein n=1 Tax=Pocillopora meandrina TaxID=46732 RepID=A0AAU9W6J6_9CNID|nr:unnamed protein product [Pocillopora meandrina]CAH3165055.1 unnamed protein product [Pocillopora meandrina]